MNVLLTNDDGINSTGLRALYHALLKAGHNVVAAAPMRQQSAVGRSLTVFQPLQAARIEAGDFEGTGIFGTPTDCVKLALAGIAPWTPDLVMSGINEGPNVGSDINYSGTVGAAAEGAHASIPSMAISHASHKGCDELDEVAAHAVKIAEKLDWNRIPAGRVINVNYPDVPFHDAKGPVVCVQSSAVWKNVYNEREDPRGQKYWWLVGEMEEDPDAINDRRLLARGHITITPLQFEYTDGPTLDLMRDMDFLGGEK